MSGVRSIFARMGAMFRDRELDERIDEELRFHVEMQTEENIRRGMTPKEARRRALIDSGGVQAAKEMHRRARGLPWLESVFQDVRFALRSLRRTPGVTVAALVTLSLGIGIGATIFSLVYAVLLRPLPYKEPDRLVAMWSANPEKPRTEDMNRWMPVTEFLEWQRQTDLFEGVAAFHDSYAGIITSLDSPEFVIAQQTGPAFFELLGVRPLLGRLFTPEEERTGAPVLLMQYDLWQRRFGGDPGVVGKTIRFAEKQWTLIGVMPRGFQFFTRTSDLFRPLNWTEVTASQLSWRNLRVFARLKEGVSLEQAQERVDVLSPGFDDSRRTQTKGWRTQLIPLANLATAEFRPALFALFGAAIGVLLIMCANLANLLLVKTNGRTRELAVRAALGASRGRIVRVLLTESLLLSLVGCMLGLGLCALLLPLLQAVLPGARSADYSVARLLVQLDAVGLDGAVAAFAVGCSLCAGLVFGLMPAIRCSRPNLDEDLKDVGRGSSGRRTPRIIRALAVTQVAVSVALVVGATLVARSVMNLYEQGPGFESSGLTTVSVTWPEWESAVALPGPEAPQEERRRMRSVASRAFERDIYAAVEGIPGVTSVASGFVAGTNMATGPVAIEASVDDPWTQPFWASNSVTPNYFATMGIPILAGRNFDISDRPTTTRVVMINQEAAQRFWPGDDPIGKRIRWARFSSGDDWLTIIGVVGDVRVFGLDQPPPPTVYYSQTQYAGPVSRLGMIIKTEGDPNALLSSILDAIRSVNRSTLISDVREVQAYVDDLSWGRRLATRLLTGLSALALLLASVGIYGVLSHAVGERRREIGVRMALGSTKRAVVGNVLRESLWITGIGMTIGLGAAAVLTRYLQSLLYGIEPLDPTTFALSAALLIAAALLASYIPARRAASVDPMAALRHE